AHADRRATALRIDAPRPRCRRAILDSRRADEGTGAVDLGKGRRPVAVLPAGPDRVSPAPGQPASLPVRPPELRRRRPCPLVSLPADDGDGLRASAHRTALLARRPAGADRARERGFVAPSALVPRGRAASAEIARAPVAAAADRVPPPPPP